MRFDVTFPSQSELTGFPDSTVVSFVPMNDVGDDGVITLNETRELREVKSGYTYFRNGDVVVAKITPCFENGKGGLAKGLVNGVGFGTTELTVIRAREHVDPRFLYYFTMSNNFRSVGEGHMYGAGGQKRVPDAFIKNVQFPSIDKTSQEAIADFLDDETMASDSLIADYEQLVALLEEKRLTIITQAVTKGLDLSVPMKQSGIEHVGLVPENWLVLPVKRALRFLDFRRVPLSAEERGLRQGHYPYYGASGIIDYIDDYIFDESLVLVAEDGANLVNRSTPVAFSASGKYWVNNHAHILKPYEGQEIAYWAARLEVEDMTPLITGSAQPKLTAEALGQLKISMPVNPNERKAINDYVLAISSKYEERMLEVRQTIEFVQERKTALITAAVTGQIDVATYNSRLNSEVA